MTYHNNNNNNNNNHNNNQDSNQTIIDLIKETLAQMRPLIHAHEGDIEFVSFDCATGTVFVKLHGACVQCPLSLYTLKMGIEEQLKQTISPGLTVVAVQE
jgi:NFU1 iron-sulfur cluster scaffold homolog, mitochondrial